MLIFLTGVDYLAICTFNLNSYELNFWHTVDCSDAAVGTYLNYTTVARVCKNNYALLIGNSTFLDYFHLNFDNENEETVSNPRVSKSHGFSKQMSVSVKKSFLGESNRSGSKHPSDAYANNSAKKHEGFIGHGRISMRQPSSMKEITSPVYSSLERKDNNDEYSADMLSFKQKKKKVSNFKQPDKSNRSKVVKKSIADLKNDVIASKNPEEESEDKLEFPIRMVGEDMDSIKKKGYTSHEKIDKTLRHCSPLLYNYSPEFEEPNDSPADLYNLDKQALPLESESVENQMKQLINTGKENQPHLISCLNQASLKKPKSSTNESNSIGIRER
jgi:hypothetical protein